MAALQRDFLGRGLDDLSVVTVSYDDVPVVIEANYFVPGTHRECVIVGERGSLVADYGAGTVTLYAGEHVNKGETLMEVHTDKVNAEIPSPVAGVVEDLLLEVGDPVAPGQPIARIAPE